jgi:hypothetical protein
MSVIQSLYIPNSITTDYKCIETTKICCRCLRTNYIVSISKNGLFYSCLSPGCNSFDEQYMANTAYEAYEMNWILNTSIKNSYEFMLFLSCSERRVPERVDDV